jgi:ABC-type multidrug transport system fused ATPase/permease subunit
VDPKVARSIFDSVVAYIREKPSHRAAVIVLSQLNLLQECDRIVHVEKGELAFNGNYEGLMRSALGSAFLESYASENEPGQDIRDGDEQASDLPSSAAAESTVTTATTNVVPLDSKSLNFGVKTKGGGVDGDITPATDELVNKENVVRGAVAWKVVDEWAKVAHRPTLALSVSGYVLSVVVLALNDVFIALWAANDDPNAGFAAIYACLSFGHLFFLVVASFILVYAATKAGENLHEQCFRSVIAAPMSWFESTPSGRIISRFGNDIEAMDTRWSMLLESGINQMTMFSNIILMMCIIVPQLTPLIIFCIAGLGFSMATINTVNRDLKRLSNNSVAPVVTNVYEAERARDVALAIGCEDFFVKRHSIYIDDMLKAHFMENAISDCSLLTAQVWCLVIILSVALIILVGDVVPPGLAPIALAYAVICPHSGQVCFFCRGILCLYPCILVVFHLFTRIRSASSLGSIRSLCC